MGTVGQEIPHDSAYGHVTGEALYVDDMPFAKNELIVDFLGSPMAHGTITRLDLAEARQVDGIVGLYTHKDVPGHNCFGPIIEDELFLAETVCEYVGQPVVVIAANSHQAIKEAKKKIILQLKALPAILTIDQALEAGQFLGVKRKIERGTVETAFDNADHVLEGTFRNNGQEQFYLESQAAIAYPGEGREITLLSSSQNPTEGQAVVAEMLGIGKHEVISVCRRMGGAFGGKETQAAIPSMMAALVATLTKRPARVVYTKDDDMKVTGKRHPYQTQYKVAFNTSGIIQGVVIDLYSNGGIAADLSTSVMERSMLHSDNAYYLPNVKITGTVCKTNLPPNTAFRGFGGPQGIAVIENIMEDIAVVLKKDAYDIRRQNIYQASSNVTPYGQIVENTILDKIFDRLAISSDYFNRLAEIQAFNQNSQTHLRGISMTPVKFGISFTTAFLNQGNALVNVYTDGTIQVSTGGTEMGQGLNTKICQIVADEFGIDWQKVKVMTTSTEKNNNASPTAASAGTDLNGMAAVDACEKIKAEMLHFAALHFASPEQGISPSIHAIVMGEGIVFDKRLPENRLSFEAFVNLAYRNRVNLGARGFYRTPSVDFNRETGKGHPFFYYTSGCSVSEVLIDRFTGDMSVERADILMDIGKSINPGIDRGQIEGGFIQGVGWVTNEELRYEETGNLLSYSPTTYKIPNIQDLPKIFHVDLIENPEHRINVRQSKAVGEPPLMLCFSVWAAAKHALSFCAQGKPVTLNIPATNEELLMRLTELTEGEAVGETHEIPIVPTFASQTQTPSSKNLAE